MEHFEFYPYPNPKDKTPLFINDPQFVDGSFELMEDVKNSANESDNIRVYAVLDLNKTSIIRRLDEIIHRYGGASEDNESYYSLEVERLVSQIDIYDRIHYVRNMPKDSEHSKEGVELVREFVDHLENIPDECSELFPMDLIEELQTEFLQ